MAIFHIEDRLRSFARMITGNYRLKVIFTGTTASITTDLMTIPPLEDTQEALSKAKFLVAHESGHVIHSIMDLKDKASKHSVLLGDILNSLEDARIEKLMIERFEGLQEMFHQEIHRIISENDYSKIPLSVQILHGLYMMAKGYDLSPISKEAISLISGFDNLAKRAVSAKTSHTVLKISEQIYEKLKGLEDEHKANSPCGKASDDNIPSANNLPDMVINSLDDHKIDPDYDDMGDYPYMKDENVEESETETLPSSYPLSDYLNLIRHHTKHQSYLIQHLRSIIETKRQRCRKKSIQTMQRTGSVDIRRIWKLSTGDDRVMKQRVKQIGLNRDTDPDSLAIYVLLDESHSMNTADRIRYSREAVAILGEVLSELGISFAITGYSTDPGLRRYLYKQFDEDYHKVRMRLAGAKNRNGTYTQEHIPYALRRLESRKERKKLLLVVTDAEEVESEIRFKRAVELARDADVEILGLGINTNFMQQYFHRFVQLTDLNRLGEEILNLLRSVLTR